MYQWCMRVCMCNIQQYRSNLYVCWCLPFSRAILMRKKYVLRLWYVFPCMPICVSMMIGETKINNKTATFIVISSDRFFFCLVSGFVVTIQLNGAVEITLRVHVCAVGGPRCLVLHKENFRLENSHLRSYEMAFQRLSLSIHVYICFMNWIFRPIFRLLNI